MRSARTTEPAWEPAPARPFDRIDLFIATTVCVISLITAALYLPAFRAAGGRGQFYQDQFAAAVMSACGRGYVAPAAGSAPRTLQAFLDVRTDAFNCADLPEHVSTTPLSSMQGAFRYLMTFVGAVWRITGVRWNAVDVVLSLLFATSLTAGYLALRFVAGRTLAVIATMLWMFSPMHLGNLPHLRDYAKTPFFLLLLVAMGVVVRERRGWALALAGAVFGIVEGIGFGMRTDVILNLVPFLLVLFATGARGWREQIPARLVTAALACVMFTGVAWPILSAYGESDGLSHVALLGLTTPFDERLGIRPAPYSFGGFYNDSFVSAQVHGDWQRVHGGEGAVGPMRYADASREYYLKLARTFPGDFLTRMAGSVIQTLNLPFTVSYGFVPLGITSNVLTTLGGWRTRLMLAFIGAGPLVAIGILIVLSLSSVRDGLLGFVLLLFWTTYPFIQFHGRHTFHLEFLVIASFVGFLSLLARSVRHIAQGRRPSLKQTGRATGLLAGLLVVSIVFIAGARAVQAAQVQRLLTTYERARADVITSPAALFGTAAPAPVVQQAMIVVDVSASGCARPPGVVTLRYPPDADADFTQDVRVSVRPARIFAPVYAMTSAKSGPVAFSGVEVPPESAACVRVSQVRGIEPLLWVDATLAPGWQNGPLHQRVYIGTAFPERVWLKLAHWWPSLATVG